MDGHQYWKRQTQDSGKHRSRGSEPLHIRPSGSVCWVTQDTTGTDPKRLYIVVTSPLQPELPAIRDEGVGHTEVKEPLSHIE